MTEVTSRRDRRKVAPQALEAEPRKGADAPLSEWLVAALGVILVVGSIGFMAYSAVIGESTPPKVLIRQETVIPSGSGFLVTFRAYNEGEATAEAVTIEGTLSRGGSAIESSEVEIDYLPAHSERQGGLFFTKDPRQYELSFRPKGYTKP